MKLYSYSFIAHNFHFTNYIFIALIIVIALVIIGTGIFYYRNRSNLRFRSLFILVTMLGALIIAMQTGRVFQQKNADSQTTQTVQIMRNISKQKKVPLDQMYSSSNNLVDGMTIQAGKDAYVVHFNTDMTNYTVTPTKLVSQPQHVNSGGFTWSSSDSQYGTIFLKFLIGFIMIVLQINLSGKGNLAPSNAVDQLQNYILGGIIGGVIYNQDITPIQFVIILLIWSVIVFASKFLTGTSNTLNKMINGSPQILILNGVVNVNRALRNGLTANQLAFKLRTHGVNDFKDVKNATLEENGQLTVTLNDEPTMNYPIITDGQLNENVASHRGLDANQVEQLCENQGCTIQDVYLGQFGPKGNLDLVLYPKKRKVFKRQK
ncbi:DUF3290 family protein [Fructilactobacillus fructivorans]|uniref:Putative membrane protein yetF n=1 Tax=Fructilactobacillus fructivorans TaxID=1614 RepID=A0A0C1Q368_9LACO|nr:DUF3290 family protein [Fructilactobacillus fructivorans]KID42273.1 putative membrane protein yetF [Fructilactobacillus fructivorans]MCT0151106.1 DUF3290 family protein [Fructilactobacillus fructivorans]MCT2867336.1 DUF3290 family protein [Fructilactobacillus fructivorans]MCT2869145.1 DUF3290 family protein [Fructilactobacillus fructivorans]MCT2873135.1 DUF3290 family protein [Fructilactobacillus fructivorans]